MYLTELLKEGIEVKIQYHSDKKQIAVESDPVAAQLDVEDFNPVNGKIKLKTRIICEQTNFKKVDAEIEFYVQSITQNRVVMVAQQIIEVNEEEIDVSSSAIEFINYLPEEESLIIQFWNGAYVYYQVPYSLYALLITADSKGKAFHKYIEGRFDSDEISEDATVDDVKEMVDKYLSDKRKVEEVKKMKNFIISSSDVEKLVEIFEKLKVDNSLKMLYLQNPNTPSDLITKLYQEVKSPYQQAKILAHQNVSLELLEEAAYSTEHYWHRKSVAENIKTPLHLLEKLLKDDSQVVRKSVLTNPSLPEDLKNNYLNNWGEPKGYIKLPQWYSDVAHIDFLNNVDNQSGDAQAMTKILGSTPEVKILPEAPKPSKGEVVMRVEGNGLLTLVDHNFDSSD